MQSVKIVIIGPFGSGKTTFIRAVSEITVLSTERQVSDPSGRGGGETTVAMDFGRVSISDDIVLYLFGTPGEERFSFMWDALSEGMLGVIVLVDGSRRESIPEARTTLDYFRQMPGLTYVVTANRVDADDSAKLEQLRTDLALGERVPLLALDARDRQSVKAALLGLLRQVLESTG